MNNKKPQIHSTPESYMETQCGKKPQNDFLIYQKKYIHMKHRLPCFPATIGRRIQPLSFQDPT
jgi:hypothetical protein